MSIKEMLSRSLKVVCTGAKILINDDSVLGENSKKMLSDDNDAKKFLQAIDNLAEHNEISTEEIELSNGKVTIEML